MSLARLTTALPGSLVGMPRGARSLLMSAALLLAGWSALYLCRSAYIVEGTIRAVVERSYPWSVGGRFDIVMEQKPGQWLRFPSLHGTCTNAQRLAAACVKPEFPIGSTIRLTVFSFADPNTCPDLGRFLFDVHCFGRMWRRHTYVSAIGVGGRPVVTGWSPNLSVLALYGFVAALSGLLAWHEWQVSRIRARTLILYTLMLSGCTIWPIARYF
jgi:hypothetical protein